MKHFNFLIVVMLFRSLALDAADSPLHVEFEKEIRPALVRLCGECHSKDKDVQFLKAVKLADINAHRGEWRSAVDQLRNRTMPPADEKLQPSEDERMRLANWLESTLRHTASTMGDYAGAPISRRLNRLEYDNSIRDLLGLELNFSETFPTEGSGGEGFSNNGETLFLPAILMERYLEAAQQIMDSAIISPPLKLEFSPEQFNPVLTAGRIKKNEEAAVTVSIFVTGDYEVSIKARTDADTAAFLTLKVDGIAVNKIKTARAGTADVEKPSTAILRLQRGMHSISLGGMSGADAPEIVLTGLSLEEKQVAPKDSKLAAHQRVMGKNSGAFAAMTENERRREARQILNAFGSSAFRRPMKPEELDRFMSLYERSATRGDAFEEAVKLALKAVLISPHFLFRAETEYAQVGIHLLNDYELASRLSYFLWASMPDEELLALAAEKKLNRPEILSAQVDRMLKVSIASSKPKEPGTIPKSRAFIEDFTGQWLGTKEVGASVAFTAEKYKGIYTSDLADDLRAEPVQVMQYLITENRSLLELISADYIFSTERIAKHYAIEGVTGKSFRKVEVSGGRRGGLLGLGAVHMITSYPDRTSPVLRGAWVLESMLGVRVPNPPPDIPPLATARKKQKDASLRAALELHRANPTCAACHNLVDPIGFGLENFDLIGRWRDVDEKLPVDATGVMPSGEKFNGPGELKKVLLGRKNEFARHLCTKMLGYALGRSLDDRDDVTIEKLVTALERDEFRAQTLIKEVVLSTPFRNRQGMEAPRKNATTKKKKALPAAKPL